MSRKQLIWALIAMVATLGAADYFFLHLLFPMKRAAMIERFNRAVEEHINESRGAHEAETAAAAQSPAPAEPRDTKSFVASLARCFGDSATDGDPDGLLARLATTLAEHATELENWHLRRPDGSEERLMLIADGAHREVRLFGVDKEGLPVPKKLDKKIARDPSPETLEALRLPGDVIYHQTHETMKFRDGSSAKIERVNDRVRDLQVFLRGKTFACRELDCQCR